MLGRLLDRIKTISVPGLVRLALTLLFSVAIMAAAALSLLDMVPHLFALCMLLLLLGACLLLTGFSLRRTAQPVARFCFFAAVLLLLCCVVFTAVWLKSIHII